jgi:N-acetyl-gamma-glutamylphosphate reductase
VNKSTLNITGLVFSNPTPTSIHINQTQVLGNKAIYHPTIYAFNATIMLVGATAPLATVAIPQTEAEDGVVIDVDTDLTFDNSDAVMNFTKAVLSTESFGLNVYGKPDLKEGPLPTSQVTFNKTVTMNGRYPFPLPHLC